MVLIPPAEEGNVTVVVRVRPQIPREQEGNRQSTVQVLSDNMLLFDPEQSSLLGFQIHESVPQKKGKNMKFIFDRVFGEMATQAEVFENTTKEILNGVLSGHNCSGKESIFLIWQYDSSIAKNSMLPNIKKYKEKENNFPLTVIELNFKLPLIISDCVSLILWPCCL